MFLSQFPYSVEKQPNKVEKANKLPVISNFLIQIYWFILSGHLKHLGERVTSAISKDGTQVSGCKCTTVTHAII